MAGAHPERESGPHRSASRQSQTPPPSRIVDHSQSTATGRPSPVVVLATTYRVVGTRGRRRLVMVLCCPFCHCWHVHSAAPDFASGKRTAACHQGRYVVHLGALEDGAA